MYFFNLYFNKVKWITRLTIFFAISFLLIWIYFNLINGGIIKVERFSNAIEILFCLFLFILYYYQTIKKPSVILIHKQFSFWLVTAGFIYFSITFIIFLIPTDTTTNQMDLSFRSIIIPISNIIYQLFIAFAFTIDSTNKKNIERKQGSIYNVIDF